MDLKSALGNGILMGSLVGIVVIVTYLIKLTSKWIKKDAEKYASNYPNSQRKEPENILWLAFCMSVVGVSVLGGILRDVFNFTNIEFPRFLILVIPVFSLYCIIVNRRKVAIKKLQKDELLQVNKEKDIERLRAVQAKNRKRIAAEKEKLASLKAEQRKKNKL